MSDTPISPSAGALAVNGVLASLVAGTVTAIAPTVGAAALAGVAGSLATAITVMPAVNTEEQSIGGVVQWPSVPNNGVGAPSPNWRYKCGSFSATGTFNGASVALQGSQDGVSWFALSPSALTAAGIFAALGESERPKFVRPSVTGGGSQTAVSVVGWFS